MVLRAHQAGLPQTSIRLIGGAALRLAYFERDTTADIDAEITPLDDIRKIAAAIGADRHWPPDWLNADAAMFIPRWGKEVDWLTLYDDGTVSISVAPVEALLAMKLLAGRPGRDTDDIARLLALVGITTTAGAEALFEAYYPGDSLTERTVRLIDRIFDIGLPEAPPTPPRPQI